MGIKIISLNLLQWITNDDQEAYSMAPMFSIKSHITSLAAKWVLFNNLNVRPYYSLDITKKSIPLISKLYCRVLNIPIKPYGVWGGRKRIQVS